MLCSGGRHPDHREDQGGDMTAHLTGASRLRGPCSISVNQEEDRDQSWWPYLLVPGG